MTRWRAGAPPPRSDPPDAHECGPASRSAPPAQQSGSPRRSGRALDAQTIIVTTEATWGGTISELAADLDRVCARRDQLTTDIEAAFLDHPLGRVLTSLCGFGPRTGARTLAEIGDPHRFADGSRLASYARLAPVDWQSGRSATSRKPRGGNHRLKNAPLHRGLRRDPTRPRRPRLLPTQTSRRQTPQRRRRLRRPPPLQHHPGHAQNPNPLPATPPQKLPRAA